MRATHDSPSIWYFAYGSNLDPATFCGKRGMQPLNTLAGNVCDFELRFDLPVGSSNRGVANLVRAEGSEVWGVAYQIPIDEAQRLDRTEGVHRELYCRTPVTIKVQDSDELEAFTYTSVKGRKNRLPSARYLGLIVTGAIYHRLPAPWIEQLRDWPLALDERERRQLKLF